MEPGMVRELCPKCQTKVKTLNIRNNIEIMKGIMLYVPIIGGFLWSNTTGYAAILATAYMFILVKLGLLDNDNKQ